MLGVLVILLVGYWAGGIMMAARAAAMLDCSDDVPESERVNVVTGAAMLLAVFWPTVLLLHWPSMPGELTWKSRNR